MRFGVATVSDLTWKEIIDGFSCTECGRCQDVCPAHATGKVLSPKLADHGRARPGLRDRARRGPIARQRRAGGDDLGLRHVRRVRRGVPGVDRARRPHRRPAPQPRDGRLAVPGGGGADAARRRARVEPVGQAADRAGRLGGRARRARPRSRATRRRSTSTGSAAPPRSTSARARRRSRRRSCCRRRASTSRSSARARRAPATRRGGWATSTCSRSTPSRTSRR